MMLVVRKKAYAGTLVVGGSKLRKKLALMRKKAYASDCMHQTQLQKLLLGEMTRVSNKSN